MLWLGQSCDDGFLFVMSAFGHPSAKNITAAVFVKTYQRIGFDVKEMES